MTETDYQLLWNSTLVLEKLDADISDVQRELKTAPIGRRRELIDDLQVIRHNRELIRRGQQKFINW